MKVDSRTIGTGKPGPMTRDLERAVQEADAGIAARLDRCSPRHSLSRSFGRVSLQELFVLHLRDSWPSDVADVFDPVAVVAARAAR